MCSNDQRPTGLLFRNHFSIDTCWVAPNQKKLRWLPVRKLKAVTSTWHVFLCFLFMFFCLRLCFLVASFSEIFFPAGLTISHLKISNIFPYVKQSSNKLKPNFNTNVNFRQISTKVGFFLLSFWNYFLSGSQTRFFKGF